ncbi:MAG TPA: hypothetical protein VGF25_21655 [Thermoleophilaceae bacterium]
MRLLATAAAAVALLLSGCGSDEEGKGIPAQQATALMRQLQSVQNRIDNGSVDACRDITGGDDPNTDAVQQVIDSLPKDVDPDVKDALQESFDHLFTLTDDQCDKLEQEQQDNTPTETETTPPPETETETAPPETETETAPPETDTTPPETNTAPPETTPSDQGNNGNGNGNGNGTGNGGSGGAAPEDGQ